ncbi:MAG: FAD-dependent oxidoreductase, partial [Chloroflexota bacterium]
KEYGVVLADASRSGFIDLARNGGARVHAETRAVGLEPLDDEVRVVTDRGTIHAHRVVLATAGWSNDLLATLDLHVPLTVTREHVAYYPYPKDATILPFIAHAGPGKFEFYGLPNGPEPVVKVAKHGAGPEVDPNTEPLLEPRRLEDVNRFVERHLPSLQTVPSRAETCLYASTPDDDFVIDRRGSIVLGMGFGGHGFKFGPVIGAMLADLATDDAAAAAPKFSVARFAQRG